MENKRRPWWYIIIITLGPGIILLYYLSFVHTVYTEPNLYIKHRLYFNALITFKNYFYNRLWLPAAGVVVLLLTCRFSRYPRLLAFILSGGISAHLYLRNMLLINHRFLGRFDAPESLTFNLAFTLLAGLSFIITWMVVSYMLKIYKITMDGLVPGLFGKTILIGLIISLILPWAAVKFKRGSVAGRPNVIFIVIDCMRADMLNKHVTPHIYSIAENSINFTNIRAQSPWTLPSAATLFTGLYSSYHGTNGERRIFRENFVTLTEELREYGYTTWGLTNGWFAVPGTEQGFDVYRANAGFLPKIYNSLEDILASLDSSGSFGFIHLLDAHADYKSDEKYLKEMTGQIKSQFTPSIKNLTFASLGNWSVNKADIAFVKAHYQAALRTIDDYIGKLIETLKQKKVYNNTIIILTGDHGEAFYEHKLFAHSLSLYEEMVRVPLIISWPAKYKYRQNLPLLGGLVDIKPTIMSMLGLPERGYSQGRSLLKRGGLVTTETKPYEFSEVFEDKYYFAFNSQRDHDYLREIKAVTDGRWKLLYFIMKNECRLFNLKNDPGETHDVKDKYPEVTSRLKNQILWWQGNNTSLTWANPDFLLKADKQLRATSDNLKILKSLGYLQ